MGTRVRLAALAAAGLVITGCASSPAAPAAVGKAAATSASETPSASLVVVRAVSQECAGGLQVAHSVVALGDHSTLAELGLLGPTWSRQLEQAAKSASASDVPEGPNRANELAVALAKMALTVGFADMAYDGGQYGTAGMDYGRFIRQLTRLVHHDCGM